MSDELKSETKKEESGLERQNMLHLPSQSSRVLKTHHGKRDNALTPPGSQIVSPPTGVVSPPTGLQIPSQISPNSQTRVERKSSVAGGTVMSQSQERDDKVSQFLLQKEQITEIVSKQI